MPRFARLVIVALSVAGVAAGPPSIGPFDASMITARAPRLVDARYLAEYADGNLSGSLTWQVANGLPNDADWAFVPPRVALGELEWDSGRRVRLARLPSGREPGRLAVAVPASGGHLTGEWSARSSDDRGARRFELRFPAAGVATLDLTLPADFRPVCRTEEALRTGPFPANEPGRRRWRFSFGGRDRLTLVIPSPSARTTTDPGPLARASRWALAADRADGTVTVTPDRPFVAWEDSAFALEGSSTVTGIACDGPCEWFLDPPTESRPWHQLRVRPSDPDGVSRVVVALRTTPAPGEVWAVPTVRPLRRAPQDETVVVRVAPSLRATSLESGDYRAVSADTDDAGERTFRFDGSFARTAASDRKPPRLTFDDRPPDVTVAERATYVVDPTTSRLHVVATVNVRRGPLTSVRITAPAPFRFAAAPNVSREEGAHRPDPTGPTYDMTLTRPLGSGQTASVSFSLLASTPAPQNGLIRVPVPAVQWETGERSGTVTVRPSSAFDPLAPLVVAYQDRPPNGDVVLPVAVAPVRRPFPGMRT